MLAVAAFFAPVTGAGAETCKLEIKKVDSSGSGQGFFMQIGGPAGMIQRSGDKEKPKFSEIVKKEPAKYAAEHPFRGVAKLGSQYFAFVFDSAPPKEPKRKKAEKKNPGEAKKSDKRLKAILYTRLHFDFNHNGDLTDDEIVEARESNEFLPGRSFSLFPPVDLEIEIDGTKTAYAFRMEVLTYSSREFSVADVSLKAAAAREGELVLNGKKYRVKIVDYNSNGRFNDAASSKELSHQPDGRVYMGLGDRLYVRGPDSKVGSRYDVASNDALHYVGKLIKLDGAFYDLKITPAGDELSLSPSSIPVGYVSNPNEGYRAVVYGDGGFLRVIGDKDGKSPLPEGEWKLLCYTIDRTGWKKPEESEPKTGEEPESQPGISADSTPRKTAKPRDRKRTGPTIVSGRGKRDYRSVKVEQGKTVELPFGPPYLPVVFAEDTNQEKREVQLTLSLVGVGGEACSELHVGGRRPEKPKFTITTKDGKEVESGVFEYG